jgi:hypothetical protein
VVIAFMSAALGMGLWNLEEDARRAAIAFFGLPSASGLVGGVVTAFYEKPPTLDLVAGVTCLFVIGLPVRVHPRVAPYKFLVPVIVPKARSNAFIELIGARHVSPVPLVTQRRALPRKGENDTATQCEKRTRQLLKP